MRAPIDQYIIDRVLEIRKKSKISQEKLAYSLEMESKGFIGAVESLNEKATKCYNVKHLNRIALILNCSPKDFWPEQPILEYKTSRKRRVKQTKQD